MHKSNSIICTDKLEPGHLWRKERTLKYYIYSGPSVLRPPMGPRKCGLTLQVVLKYRSFNTENCHLGPNQAVFMITKGGLKIEDCKIERLLYTYSSPPIWSPLLANNNSVCPYLRDSRWCLGGGGSITKSHWQYMMTRLKKLFNL